MVRTLSDADVASIAAAHERARRTVVPIDPPTRTHPDMTVDDAYAVQAAWIEVQVAGGAVVRGHKVGLTSRAMQQAMRIDEPDFGTLLDDMFVEPGGTIAAADYLDPKLEVEFAFVLGADLRADLRIDLGADLADSAFASRSRRTAPPTDATQTGGGWGRAGPVTAADVYAATERIAPALELIDARSHRVHPVDGRPRTVRDTIADNAANAGVVVGPNSVPVAEAAAGALRWAGAVLSRNGVVEETGLGAGVLGDPVAGVVWLANRLHGLGVTLAAGETVLAGSFTRPVDCRAGDEFHADFGDLGVIELHIA